MIGISRKKEEIPNLWVSVRLGKNQVLFQSFKDGSGYWIHRTLLHLAGRDDECIWGGEMQEHYAFKGNWVKVFERVIKALLRPSYIV